MIIIKKCFNFETNILINDQDISYDCYSKYNENYLDIRNLDSNKAIRKNSKFYVIHLGFLMDKDSKEIICYWDRDNSILYFNKKYNKNLLLINMKKRFKNHSTISPLDFSNFIINTLLIESLKTEENWQEYLKEKWIKNEES